MLWATLRQRYALHTIHCIAHKYSPVMILCFVQNAISERMDRLHQEYQTEYLHSLEE